MPKYQINRQVPWAEILRIQRWHLELRIRCLRDGCSSLATLQPGMLRHNRQRLQTSYDAYLALRAFLGYTAKTVVCEKAEALLKQSQP